MSQNTGDPPFPPLQWPYQYVIPRAGWLCTKCGASLSPDVQMCPNCAPPPTATITGKGPFADIDMQFPVDK